MTINFQPFAVSRWIKQLENGAGKSIKILENCLYPTISKEEAKQVVEDAINMGLLVPRGKGKRYMLGFSQSIIELQKSRKMYPNCFECHLPGGEALTKCVSCERFFHGACWRKHPYRPNYKVPSDKKQKYQIPLNESDLEESSGEVVVPQNGIITPTPTISTESKVQYELDVNSNLHIVASNTLKEEADSSDDVCFVSEQPARLRKRANTLVKSEDDLNNEIGNDLELCTPCRLQKLTDLLNPPHVSDVELNCLLGYLWKHHHSWVSMDVRKYLAQYGNQDAALVKSALFDNDKLGISDITENIEMKRYKSLAHFLIDLLDLQHNIGIFFGPKGDIIDSTKWLLRDSTHDIREIHRCSDCFRHSNQTESCPFWFAKPCTQRHELVFAKIVGLPYWPAKVISVRTKKSSAQTMYDVRFFGQNHSRGFVSARDIQPIDSDILQLNAKWKTTHGLPEAMKELKCHMMLLHHPVSFFSFYADPRYTLELINHALTHCMDAPEVNASAKRPRTATPSSAKRSKQCATPTTSSRVQPMRRCSVARPEELLDNVQAFQTGFREMVQQITSLNRQLALEKAEIDALRNELKTVKLKKWCQLCMKEAEFDCCFNASYCSSDCKRRDRRRHQVTCGPC